jgi:hypothetical protein
MRKELADLSTKVLARKPTAIPAVPEEMAQRIRALAQYCATGSKESAMEHFPERGSSAKRGLSDARNIPNPMFEESYRKLERMIEVLVEEQFVSFIC